MRVTQSMLASNMLQNLSSSNDKMQTYQNQLASGKKLTKPSDDPAAAMRAMGYRSNLQQIQQYQSNFTEANNWLGTTDSSLGEATQVLQSVQELATQAANGTMTDSDRQALQDQVKQLRDQLVNVANTKVGNKYIFNGTNTLNPPVTEQTDPNGNTTVTVSSNNDPVNIELSKGISIQVNSTPQNAFSQKMFDDLNSLITNLGPNGDTSQLSSQIGTISDRVNDIVGERAVVGARENRVQLMEDRVNSQEVSATQMMSNNEDADTAKVITDLTAEESVQRAALSVGARVIQPTLVDFLK
jgi:flagellar hook-associated protein 3 FlgL